MKRTAVLSEDGVYRYRLSREWDSTLGRVSFVLLNPSLADALVDDQTVKKCVALARSWDCGSLDIANLYAFRATKPTVLKSAADPVGAENDRYLAEVLAEASLIVCAWGNHAAASRVDVFKKLAAGRELFCLARTLRGAPKHPLYVAGDTRPIPWD